MSTREIIFSAPGIEIYIEDGRVYEADEQNRNDCGIDTESNRAAAIADAMQTIAEWEK